VTGRVEEQNRRFDEVKLVRRQLDHIADRMRTARYDGIYRKYVQTLAAWLRHVETCVDCASVYMGVTDGTDSV
jgi:hypothetical protein